MSRLFITEREHTLIGVLNKELIQKVIGEPVLYYAINLEKTKVNRLYNETVQKTWNAPVQIDALVKFENPNVGSTGIGQDAKFTLDVHFHTQELNERNVLPKEGDFIEYNNIFFEITSVTQPELVFGQAENRIMTKCACVSSREGQFQAGNRDNENIDNSHHVSNTKTNER